MTQNEEEKPSQRKAWFMVLVKIENKNILRDATHHVNGSQFGIP
jgi:hypothetical protein